MTIELDGYNLKKKEIDRLPENQEIRIRFLLGSISGYGSRNFGKIAKYNSDLEKRIKASRLKAEKHDCRDSGCPGIGETYHVNSSKFKEIASSI